MRRKDRSGGAGVWTKFRLLMWKNFLQQWRHPLQTATELMLPVLTLSLVLVLRGQIEPNKIDTVTFPPISPYSLNDSALILSGMNNMTNISLAYSPTSPALESVLQSALSDLIIKNAVGLIGSIIGSNPTLPDNFPNITIPDIFPNITIPPDLFPNITLPENFPNITIPPDFDWENVNRTIIQEIIRSVIGLQIRSYDSSSDLRGIYALEETTRSVLAAVEFDDSLYGATELPINISYALRFPERPRQNSFYGTGSRSWRTDILFPTFEVPGPRSRSPNGGSDPGYVIEMFIALQHAISTQLVSRITGEPLGSFDVNLQRFPHPPFLQDLAVEALQFLFPMFIMMSFSYAAVNIVRAVTVEKELQLKETLKIMGMPTWINWTAWFCKQFLYLLVAAIFITVLLKVSWFTNEDGFSDYAVFTNTPWTVIFFFLVLYLACTIFFCFMVSGFFSSGSTAALFAGVIWYLTYIPAFMLSIDVSMSVGVQVFTCLSINSAMSYGFQLIIAGESSGGMHWGQFFAAPATDSSRLVFGHVIIMLIVDCIIYMLVALYLEQVLPGPFGTPKPWYFLFHRDFWCSRGNSSGGVALGVPETPDVIKENDPIDHAVGVKMSNLTKVFPNNIAVNNLNLNIYDDQITVLLGHNGAGKSTTISMLTGNLQPTSGSVWVAGYDLTWHSAEARAHVGLCPQHNVLFNELTVREHLEFFSRLKGYHGEELHTEIDSLIDKLELQEKRNYQAQGLSGGQKRRLCVGIALCGDARVVLLDEPTSGMDPSARRALWDLLQKEKKGRSMILTTHFMDEADILGDRIAIMASGRLQCVGSPYFLKREYGVGYTLVIVKSKGFQLDACNNILNKYIPNLTVKEDRGREVTYALCNDQSHVFEIMLNDLENNIERIQFKNYGLIATNLEDVFMSVGADVTTVPSESDDTSESRSDDTPTILDSEADSMDRLDDDEKSLRGFRLLVQHVLAVWLKLGLVWVRSWAIVLLQVLVPVLIIVATLGVMEYVMSLTPTVQRRRLTLEQGFTGTETLLHFDGGNSSSLGALAVTAYQNIFNSSGISTMTASVVQEPIDAYYLAKTSDPWEMGQLRHRWLTGATFSDGGATAWFSNFGYHDVAVSLAAVHDALLRARQPAAQLRVYNYPLEVQYTDQTDTQTMLMLLAMQLASGIGSSLGIASAVFIMFYIKERAIRAKLLQKASGIRPAVLWGSAAVFDWLWFLVISLTVVISCLAFGVVGLSTGAELGRLYLVLMVYGAAMLPLNYIVSNFFKGPAMGFVVMFFVNVLFGNVGAQIVDSLWQSPVETTVQVADALDYFFQLFPLYSLITAIRSMNQVGMTVHSCMQGCDFLSTVLGIQDCNMTVMCEHFPDSCCVRENAYFEWERPGVLRYIVVMLLTCVVFWAILMTMEYNIFHRLFSREKHPPALEEGAVDADVADEARAAQTARADGLVARSLSKYYGSHLAVNQLSFTVSDAECFGLLGVNGAGKTTTFKMLMGDETISSGDAFVSGYSVRKDLNKVYENIGYCPQFDAVFGELTGRETLRLFALLRGRRDAWALPRALALAHALGFAKHLDKRVNQYSGGNKRKLSTAISFLGQTRLVFVDEPTTGVDPAAKRQVWRAIRGACRAGRGVVLTSHSMEECEALCSRLTIMVNGRFQCLGTPQHLKNKYSEGFTLTIKMKMEEEQPSTSAAIVQRPVDAVKYYVETNFTTPRLMEEYQGLLTYYLPDRSIAWSRMFGIMENAKRALQIEDYSISQTTLEQIFLQFTKYQR